MPNWNKKELLRVQRAEKLQESNLLELTIAPHDSAVEGEIRVRVTHWQSCNPYSVTEVATPVLGYRPQFSAQTEEEWLRDIDRAKKR